MSGGQLGTIAVGLVVGWLVIGRLPLIGLSMRLLGSMVLIASPVAIVLAAGVVTWFNLTGGTQVAGTAAGTDGAAGNATGPGKAGAARWPAPPPKGRASLRSPADLIALPSRSPLPPRRPERHR